MGAATSSPHVTSADRYASAVVSFEAGEVRHVPYPETWDGQFAPLFRPLAGTAGAAQRSVMLLPLKSGHAAAAAEHPHARRIAPRMR